MATGKDLAEDLIPTAVSGSVGSVRDVITYYSPALTEYAAKSQELKTHGLVYYWARRSFLLNKKGLVGNGWKVAFDCVGGLEGTLLTQKQLVSLYNFYGNASQNTEGSDTYNLMYGVNYMLEKWSLASYKYG